LAISKVINNLSRKELFTALKCRQAVPKGSDFRIYVRAY
jgi:hypothetical protein